jgi:hypothetical protein
MDEIDMSRTQRHVRETSVRVATSVLSYPFEPGLEKSELGRFVDEP